MDTSSKTDRSATTPAPESCAGVEPPHALFQAIYEQGLFAGRLKLDGIVLDVNRAFVDGCGFHRKDILGKPFWECGWWNRSPGVREWVRRAVMQAASGKDFRGESRYFWADGSEHIMDLAFIPIRDAEGEVTIVVPTGMDITQRVQAERSRLALEAERFRAIVETTPECVKVVAADGTLLHMNPAGLAMVGAARAEVVEGKNVYELIAPEDRERFRRFNERVCAGEKGSLEFDMVGFEGVRRHMETHAAPLPDEHGSVLQLAITHDITQRRRVEEAQRRLAAIVDSSDDAIASKDLGGVITSWNRSAELLFGYTADEILGKSVLTIIPPELHEDEKTILAKIKAGEKIDHFQTVRLRRNGTRVNVSLTVFPIRDANGNIVGAAKIVRDITRQRELEQAASRLAAIVESSDDAIISKDLNGTVVSWNTSAEKLFGYRAEEIIGGPIGVIIPPGLISDEEMILGKIRNGQRVEHFETVRLRKSGETIDVSLSVSPVMDEHGHVIGAAKIARNITERKRAESTLRTTERLVAAGRLAATVAHEINNPLEGVMNLVYLAKLDLPDAGKVAAHLDAAQRELDRVAHIARQTLGFYRDTSSMKRLNLPRMMDELLPLYEKRLEGAQIKVVKRYDNDAEITAFAGEIRQLLSNLIVNSIDAMPSGGLLHIKISRAHRWSNSIPGVRVTICDTGSGIPARHKRNLFQPFFTTKAHVGTGLGLWVTRNIVEKHHGMIQFKSRSAPTSHGTAFSAFLPLDGKSGSARSQAI